MNQPSSELSAAHILIMHTESERVPESITRSKEEALALTKEIAVNLQAKDADFAALAKEHSDCPSGTEGGSLGSFAPNQMVPEFSQATIGLAVGEVSDLVETPFGYHIIRRQELPPKASAMHVLAMYEGSMRAPATVTRTKEEALALVEECLARYRNGEKFEDLASENSDCPSAASGGDLGEFSQGVMAPAFEQATFASEVGDVTEVVETPFGYHIIYRYQ